MSDESQTPGWWLASDGRWYPPDLRPADHAEPAPFEGAQSPQGPGWWQASDGQWYPPALRSDSFGQPAALEAAETLKPGFATAGAELATAEPAPAIGVLGEDDQEQLSPLLVGEAPSGRPSGNRRRLVVLGLLLIVVVLAVVGVVATQGTSPSQPSPPRSAAPPGTLSVSGGWILAGQRVLGGPVVADGKLLVVVATQAQTLALEAIAPATGIPSWKVPYSVSQINLSVPLTPVVEGGVVLDLSPAGAATDPKVTIKGIAVNTGQVHWSAPGAELVTDAPASCTDRGLFCVDVITPAGASALELLAPSGGDVVTTIPGAYRHLASGLFEDTSAPGSIEELGSAGSAIWKVPVQSIFGSARFSPDFGSSFDASDGLVIGSAAMAPDGATQTLSQYEAVGIRSTDGTVVWTDAGSYRCMGVLGVTAPFICRYSSDAQLSGATVSVTSPSLTLEGINPTDGSISWSQQVLGAQPLTDGIGVGFASTSSIVVTLTSGPTVVLDLRTGVKRPVEPGSNYWCSSSSMVAVQAPPASLTNGQRSGVSTYTPCSAGSPNGGPSRGVPVVATNVGVVAGGFFAWAAPGGLEALPLAH